MSRPRRSLLMVLLLAASAAAGCGGAGSARPELDPSPFVLLAQKGICSDVKRRVFVIDETMVLIDRAGSCPDNSYALTLYGRTPTEVLCSKQDSIAGPRTSCAEGSPQDLFDTMTQNTNLPDLGLGKDHKVRSVPL